MKKILIIEDEKMLKEMYVKKFSEMGYEVISAGNAENGLRKAKEERPDLILLDILLPRKNGIYTLKKIRKDPEIANIDVVAFSNFDDPNAKKEAKELGVLDYLIKTSYTPKQIVERIKEYLT